MQEYQDILQLPIEIKEDAIIKVLGIGGGGCNAVNYMYRQGIEGVSFMVCNTDRMALAKSSVPAKLQLGPGLGAGGVPEKAQQYAEENRDTISEALKDGTKMLFITAGMGGGTGTGASATVAEVAQQLGILTVGIVTIPFAFEGKIKIRKALTGVARLAQHVDAILIINNEKLKDIYPDLNLLNAFAKANDVLCNAAKAIAEIITVPGYINTDFADVYNTLKDGNVAIMNVGLAHGEDRITNAIRNALESPLVNTSDVRGAKRILLQLYCSTEHAILTQELEQIRNFVDQVGSDVEVQWGASIDDSLGEDVRITIIATGYAVSDIPQLADLGDNAEALDESIRTYYQKKDFPEKPKPADDEDEPSVEIDLTGTINGEIKPAGNKSENGRIRLPENDNIVIENDEDLTDKPQEQTPPRKPWLFRRR